MVPPNVAADNGDSDHCRRPTKRPGTEFYRQGAKGSGDATEHLKSQGENRPLEPAHPEPVEG